MLTNSYSQLRLGLQKFQDTAATLDTLTPENLGQDRPRRRGGLPMRTDAVVAGALTRAMTAGRSDRGVRPGAAPRRLQASPSLSRSPARYA